MTISSIGAVEKQALAALRAKPVVSWPSLLILLVCLSAIIGNWVLTLGYGFPLWAACIANSIAGYLLFTPAHEGIHHSLARSTRLNNFLLSVSLFMAIPFGRGRVLAMMHMRHHRFANEEKDPDLWMVSTLWTMPLWGLWPYFYILDFLRNPSQLPGLKVSEVVRELVVAAVVMGVFFAVMPLRNMIFLWLIPSYVAYFLMCLVFMILPHYPFTGRQCDDPNNTALMRMGQEWWLTPVLMYQNYHLMHHLYPTIPFYRYGKAWRCREAFHRQHSADMIVHPFDMGPRKSGSAIIEQG